MCVPRFSAVAILILLTHLGATCEFCVSSWLKTSSGLIRTRWRHSRRQSRRPEQWEKKLATKRNLRWWRHSRWQSNGERSLLQKVTWKNIVRNRMLFSGHCVVQIDFCKVLIFDGSEGWFGFCSVKKWTLRSANCKKWPWGCLDCNYKNLPQHLTLNFNGDWISGCPVVRHTHFIIKRVIVRYNFFEFESGSSMRVNHSMMSACEGNHPMIRLAQTCALHAFIAGQCCNIPYLYKIGHVFWKWTGIPKSWSI